MRLINKSLPLIFDGAMGTYYRTKSKNPLPECEMANLFDKETIVSIHKDYIDAGANAIKTNTFGASIINLNCDDTILHKIISEGVKLAKEAIQDRDVFLFGDIGPITESIEEDNLDNYKKVLDIFIECGVENFIFETFSNDKYLVELSQHIKEQVNNGYIITSFAITPDGITRSGIEGKDLLNKFAKVDSIDCVGFNCISGPYHLLEYVKSIELPNKTLCIMPNAGYPTVVNNRTFYSNNPTYYSNTLVEFMDFGFEVLGGCCGTTPDYIEKLVDKVKKMKPVERAVITREKNLRLISKQTDNLFLQKINNGKKIIAVEYDPPSSIDIADYMKNVKMLRDTGVDGITIADCPVGRARIDSSLMAYKIKNEVGIDPIVHLTCRDRNLNATKALLLGLNVEDILNLIIITGDPLPTAERDEIKTVFNFNSVLLAKYIKRLNNEIFINPMNITGALNVNSPNFDAELRRAFKKEEAGIEMFFTQPVLSQKAVENIAKAKSVLNSRIIGGIMPIVSHRNAVFMNEEIPGIKVDEKIIDRYENVEKEKILDLASEISLSFMENIDIYVDGFYIITPFNRIDIVKRLVDDWKNR